MKSFYVVRDTVIPSEFPQAWHQMEDSTFIYYSGLQLDAFSVACVKALLQMRIGGALAYFPNHRGANNQPQLRICLAVFQT